MVQRKGFIEFDNVLSLGQVILSLASEVGTGELPVAFPIKDMFRPFR